MEKVISFDGTEALRKDCRYIKGQYYIKNIQCFLINNQWYRITNPDIAFDNEYKVWVLRSTNPNLINGIIDIINNTPVFGYFSMNRALNTELLYQDQYYCVIRANVLDKSDKIIEGVNGRFYLNCKKVPRSYTVKLPPSKDSFYSFPFNYGSDPLIERFSTAFNNNFIPERSLSDVYKYLYYSFGVEFETELGAIPERHLTNSGLIACRDGSIKGFEYTTIPLTGSVGIQAIKNQCKLLAKYCSCSPNESLHVHLGGYIRSTRTLAALYRLGRLIESEIYSMFPYYYVNTAQFKRKGYCNPLYIVADESKNYREIFSEVYRFLSGNNASFSKFPAGNHPMDRSGQHKWEVSPRYYWLNLIPIIWGNRGTIEFRCHTPTVKSQKVINWIFILTAILNYAKLHKMELTNSEFNKLDPVKLSTILSESYPNNICEILEEYINERKKHYSGKHDLVGELEIFSEESTDLIKYQEFV